MREQKITAVVFLHKDWKLFVARRADTKKLLPWVYELPWWHIEFWESIEEWLRREMREEFHIAVTIGDIYHAFTYLNHDSTRHSVQLVYFTTLQDERQKIKLNDYDHSEYRRIDENEVEKIFALYNEEECKAIMRWFKILKERHLS
jgi:ADP-ribose pyrophosphatase YjhB (NUDIX family)